MLKNLQLKSDPLRLYEKLFEPGILHPAAINVINQNRATVLNKLRELLSSFSRNEIIVGITDDVRFGTQSIYLPGGTMKIFAQGMVIDPFSAIVIPNLKKTERLVIDVITDGLCIDTVNPAEADFGGPLPCGRGKVLRADCNKWLRFILEISGTFGCKSDSYKIRPFSSFSLEGIIVEKWE